MSYSVIFYRITNKERTVSNYSSLFQAIETPTHSHWTLYHPFSTTILVTSNSREFRQWRSKCYILEAENASLTLSEKSFEQKIPK